MSSKAPVKYYEIAERKSSGFIMDGTRNTTYQQELSAPSIRWIPARGKMSVVSKDAKGREVKSFKEIRYIAGCDTIDPEEQKAKGLEPSKLDDKIMMENGFMTVVREGSTIGLYDYLESVFYNLDNPNRSKDATVIYREVKLDKKAVALVDEDESVTLAKSVVYKLRKNTGDKKEPYQYDTEKIDALCKLVNVWDETPERKLVMLLSKANSNPKQFLEIVENAEQTVILDITNAIELNVLRVDGNNIVMVDENKIVLSLGAEKYSERQKLEALANFLATGAGNSSLTEIRAKTEVVRKNKK
jgi:hypothetical protein